MFNKDGKFGYTFWVLLLNNDYIRDEETGLVLVYKEKETAIWEQKYYKVCRHLDVEIVEFTDFSINYVVCDF
jgi:hypothetical protein